MGLLVRGGSGVTTGFLPREEGIYRVINKDTIWRKRRGENHLGSERLIGLAVRELQIGKSCVTNSGLSFF